MKVTNEMIHPELRKKGIVFKKVFQIKNRESFKNMQKYINISRKRMKSKKMQCTNKQVISIDNSKLRLCICRSFDPKPKAIGLLWIHGGGYGMGVPEQDFSYMEKFIGATNCVVVSPDYRLSIQEPYPAALNDCYSALLWMKKHAKQLGIRDDQLFVGGDSAGGGLTAAVTLMARDRGEVNVAFQMPLYPMIDDRMITPSSHDNDAPVWDLTATKAGWELYLGDLYGTEDVPSYAAPARETDYSGLPPTYTFVGDIEPFCDEAKEYITNLKKAGIQAEIDIYHGCYHGFDSIASKTSIGRKATKKYMERFHYAAEHYFSPQPDSRD